MGHNSRSPSGRVEDKGTRNRLTDTYRFLDAVMESVAYLASLISITLVVPVNVLNHKLVVSGKENTS